MVVVVGCTGLSALLSPHLAPTNLVMIYLLGVVAVSLRLGRGPSILASVSERGRLRFLLRAAPMDVRRRGYRSICSRSW